MHTEDTLAVNDKLADLTDLVRAAGRGRLDEDTCAAVAADLEAAVAKIGKAHGRHGWPDRIELDIRRHTEDLRTGRRYGGWNVYALGRWGGLDAILLSWW